MRVPDQSHGDCPPSNPREEEKSLHRDEEIRTLMRKWLISFLALIPAMLMPLAAAGQVTPDRGTRTDRPEPQFKNEAYVGMGYTSLNQVNQSRYGKYFGATADGAYYPGSFQSGNPGDPKVWLLLAGPELHAPLFSRLNGFFRGFLGAAHTGGTGQTPDVSFAGGLGGGLEWVLNPRLTIRASGDNIASAFSPVNNTPQLAYSAHTRWNPRAGVGVAYHF
jgi:hypothetical protein